MAELRLLQLEDVLEAKQLSALRRELRELDAEWAPENDDEPDFEETLTEDQLTDFMDRLEAHNLACTIYLPVEFEGVVEISDYTVGSALALLDALEELREELGIDEDEEEEEDDLDVEVIEEQLRVTWRLFLRAASTCVERQTPLHIIAD